MSWIVFVFQGWQSWLDCWLYSSTSVPETTLSFTSVSSLFNRSTVWYSGWPTRLSTVNGCWSLPMCVWCVSRSLFPSPLSLSHLLSLALALDTWQQHCTLACVVLCLSVCVLVTFNSVHFLLQFYSIVLGLINWDQKWICIFMWIICVDMYRFLCV